MTEPTDEIDPTTAVWWQVAAAVAYVCVLDRPGFSVWDAVEEALRWWTADHLAPRDERSDDARSELPWDDPDPLRTTIEQLFATVPAAGAVDGHSLSEVLTSALEYWIRQMAHEYNDGQLFTQLTSVACWPAVAAAPRVALRERREGGGGRGGGPGRLRGR